MDPNETMSTIIWNPNGFRLIDAMPKREKYTARYDIDNVPTPICQQLVPAGKLKFVIHTDNSQCHTAKVLLDFALQRNVRFASHPQYSPEMALSGFSFLVTENVSRTALVFRLLRNLLLRLEKRSARSHPKLYWTFLTTGLHGAKVGSQMTGTTLNKLSSGDICFA
jgi:hypothetical protein